MEINPNVALRKECELCLIVDGSPDRIPRPRCAMWAAEKWWEISVAPSEDHYCVALAQEEPVGADQAVKAWKEMAGYDDERWLDSVRVCHGEGSDATRSEWFDDEQELAEAIGAIPATRRGGYLEGRVNGNKEWVLKLRVWAPFGAPDPFVRCYSYRAFRVGRPAGF